MVHQDVMIGKRCRSANDFVKIIQDKHTPIIIDELLVSEIENSYKTLSSLFNDVKPVPNIQKIHSMSVLDVNEIECKIYSNSTKATVVYF